MIYEIKLSIFAITSIISAVLLNKSLFLNSAGKKVIAFWIIVIPFVFIVRNEMVTVLVCAAVLFILNRNSSVNVSLLLFIATLGAVPDWSNYYLSLPGISYLIHLRYWKVAVIVILIPLLFRLNSINALKWNATDSFIVLFVLYISFMVSKELSILVSFRYFVDQLLIYIVPYFVISRFVITDNDAHSCAFGFLLLAILLAAVMVMSQLVQTDIYNALNIYSGIFGILREYRGGFLRLSGPLNGVLIGILMALGYFALLSLKKYFTINRFVFIGIITAFVFSLFFGGSRGAFIGVLLSVCVYYYFVEMRAGTRTIFLSLVVIIILLELLFGVSSFIQYEDEHGTFDYRKEVHIASWEFIKTKPFFGDLGYLSSGYFDHLKTGMGIVDIVSAYLTVSLRFGLVGLILFCAIFLSSIYSMLRILLGFEFAGEVRKTYIAVYFSVLIGYLFVIGTTSMVSLIPQFGVIFVAISRALCGRANNA